MAAFDASVKVVFDWIAAKPDRQQHTLLMVLPDHETGALAIHGTEKPGLEALGYFWPAYTWQKPPEPETHHTGGDIVFWVQGPGSEVLRARLTTPSCTTSLRSCSDTEPKPGAGRDRPRLEERTTFRH